MDTLTSLLEAWMVIKLHSETALHHTQDELLQHQVFARALMQLDACSAALIGSQWKQSFCHLAHQNDIDMARPGKYPMTLIFRCCMVENKENFHYGKKMRLGCRMQERQAGLIVNTRNPQSFHILKAPIYLPRSSKLIEQLSGL
ncbi:hypothetical protein CDAR_63711 [Caerostris darwini]|uniref:Uncharacterized protein n=1 Tax=Caerostris darwini TaxID=1538125 RepID=A0AAV4R042_9ARAC|nr:hypothetical protein CDAR_63711 [Caerostris darwini]